MPTVVAEGTGERDLLLQFVEAQRGALRRAVSGLTTEQATASPLASELDLIGLVKHVAETESSWVRGIIGGLPPYTKRDQTNWTDSFHLVGDDTVESVLAFLDQVAAETEKIVNDLPSLDVTFPLPPAPWFPKDAVRSARWVLLHLVEEHARHAGHADVIREQVDGKAAFELIPMNIRRPND